MYTCGGEERVTRYLCIPTYDWRPGKGKRIRRTKGCAPHKSAPVAFLFTRARTRGIQITDSFEGTLATRCPRGSAVCTLSTTQREGGKNVGHVRDGSSRG
jgi:hypothetical protein